MCSCMWHYWIVHAAVCICVALLDYACSCMCGITGRNECTSNQQCEHITSGLNKTLSQCPVTWLHGWSWWIWLLMHSFPCLRAEAFLPARDRLTGKWTNPHFAVCSGQTWSVSCNQLHISSVGLQWVYSILQHIWNYSPILQLACMLVKCNNLLVISSPTSDMGHVYCSIADDGGELIL